MASNADEKQQVHDLLVSQNYATLYSAYPKTLNLMLGISAQEEFEDYIEFADGLEEKIFWLYHSSVQGDTLLIYGYDGDVTSQVMQFVQARCPVHIWALLSKQLQDIHVDIDDIDNLQEKIESCNHVLLETDYQLQLESEEEYCPCAYFLSVKRKAV